MKIFITRISLLVLILMIALSCTKIGKNITVKGRVLNPITGVGISGVEIKLLRSQNLQYNGGYKAIKKVVSDENGNYEINATRLGPIYLIPGEIGQNYSLGFNYEGNYYSMKKVDKGKVMHIDYHLVPYGKLRMHVQNQHCQGATDSLDIFFDGSEIVDLTGSQDANNHIGSILYAPITGCWDNLDNGFTTQMGKRYYHWTVKRGTNSQTYYDTVDVIPNGTTTLNVFY